MTPPKSFLCQAFLCLSFQRRILRSTVSKHWTICTYLGLDTTESTNASFSQTGRAHLILISRTPGIAGGAIGVITLEGVYPLYLIKRVPSNRSSLDIIEEIISEEIVDETDRYDDNVHKRKAKRMTTAAIMRG